MAPIKRMNPELILPKPTIELGRKKDAFVFKGTRVFRMLLESGELTAESFKPKSGKKITDRAQIDQATLDDILDGR